MRVTRKSIFKNCIQNVSILFKFKNHKFMDIKCSTSAKQDTYKKIHTRE